MSPLRKNQNDIYMVHVGKQGHFYVHYHIEYTVSEDTICIPDRRWNIVHPLCQIMPKIVLL